MSDDPATRSGSGVPASRLAQISGMPSATTTSAASTKAFTLESAEYWRRTSRLTGQTHPPRSASAPSTSNCASRPSRATANFSPCSGTVGKAKPASDTFTARGYEIFARNTLSLVTCAYVVLAHKDPQHLERLVARIDGRPLFLHVDAGAAPQQFRNLCAAAPEAEILPRVRSAWASWGLVEAALIGFKAALSSPATHIVLLSGQDYLLRSASFIDSCFKAGESAIHLHALPRAVMGPDGGLERIRYWHKPIRRRRFRVPIPRRFPRGAQPYVAQQWCVLSREAAEAVLRVGQDRPDLKRFYKHVWIPDEGYVPTAFQLTPFRDSNMSVNYWYSRFAPGSAHPAVITQRDLPDLLEARCGPSVVGGPAPLKLFARKFESGASDAVASALADDPT